MADLQRLVTVTPARDCTTKCEFGSDRCKPGAGGFHGITDANIRFSLTGEQGALSFVFFTGWHKKETRKARDPFRHTDGLGGVDWHWRTPRTDYEAFHHEDCDLLGGDCWTDGSGLMAMDAFEELVNGGTDSLWEWMERLYEEGEW